MIDGCTVEDGGRTQPPDQATQIVERSLAARLTGSDRQCVRGCDELILHRQAGEVFASIATCMGSRSPQLRGTALVHGSRESIPRKKRGLCLSLGGGVCGANPTSLEMKQSIDSAKQMMCSISKAGAWRIYPWDSPSINSQLTVRSKRKEIHDRANDITSDHYRYTYLTHPGLLLVVLLL
ncbi:hypothetical protein BDV37DRAFT_223897 [Aspergillus pseudonomiae]|uniref:Uncharacterized protein n=1 Tax=Aspergillus pseudonomiae TaxID=1506151 RepID=A0A5N7DN94_9EURO|nr:uncharacterized protein BDV37DRAFT_223897 [Aspergillus pseudonomiae]KAE8407876.1 hypothetical protein BDV37DRAFT_223897 [Aspergillus pseudonomiae]